MVHTVIASALEPHSSWQGVGGFSPFYFWHSPTGVEVQFSPGQFHWYEYETPIKSSSLGLYELHHAVRGRWAAEGNKSWKYWVKILMEWSQSPSQPQPNAHMLFGYMSATFLLMCSCFRPKADKVRLRRTWFHTQTTEQTWGWAQQNGTNWPNKVS